MTPQEQIKALAELDGWTYSEAGWVISNPQQTVMPMFPPNYLISYNAIIPLIQKVLNRHTCHSFFDALGLLAIKDWQDCDGAPSYEGDGSYFEIWVLFKATPQQLCEALLRATGKWKE